MNRYTVTLFALMLAFAIPPAFATGEPASITRTTSSNVAVRIRVLMGSIRIVGWNRDRVRVRAQFASPNQKLQVMGNRDHLAISVGGKVARHVAHPTQSVPMQSLPNVSTVPAGNASAVQRQAQAVARQASQLAKVASSEALNAVNAAMGVFGSAELTVHVPRGATIEVTSIGAPVSIRNVEGALRLQTVNGAIKVVSDVSDINAKSVTGTIVVKGSGRGAYANLATVSSSILVAHFDGNLTAETMAGAVHVRACRLHRVHLSTTSGNVTFNSPLENGGNYRFSVWSGNLRLALSDRPNAVFHFSSFSGKIISNIGPKPKRSDPYLSSTEVRFRSGNGSAYVRAESMSGSITLVAEH